MAIKIKYVMNIDKFVTDLTKNPRKALVYAILFVLIIIAIYWLFSKLKGGITSIVDNISNVRDNPVEDDNLTHDDTIYKQDANTIFNAMNGAGTDYDTIVNVVTRDINNNDDWNKLKREFGTRTLKIGLWDDMTGNLVECLASELDRYEKANFNAHLKQRNITDRI